MIQSHRDLLVWQRAIQLSTETYKLTADFPKEEIYGLTSQLRRASVSVASNIAEGYGRGTKGEYKQFLAIARGSNLELDCPRGSRRQVYRRWGGNPAHHCKGASVRERRIHRCRRETND